MRYENKGKIFVAKVLDRFDDPVYKFSVEGRMGNRQAKRFLLAYKGKNDLTGRDIVVRSDLPRLGDCTEGAIGFFEDKGLDRAAYFVSSEGTQTVEGWDSRNTLFYGVRDDSMKSQSPEPNRESIRCHYDIGAMISGIHFSKLEGRPVAFYVGARPFGRSGEREERKRGRLDGRWLMVRTSRGKRKPKSIRRGLIDYVSGMNKFKGDIARYDARFVIVDEDLLDEVLLLLDDRKLKGGGIEHLLRMEPQL